MLKLGGILVGVALLTCLMSAPFLCPRRVPAAYRSHAERYLAAVRGALRFAALDLRPKFKIVASFVRC